MTAGRARHPRLRKRYPVLPLLLAVVALAGVTVALVAIVSPRLQTNGSAGAATPGAVTVGASTVGAPLPAGFVGLSMEYRGFNAYAGENPAAPNPAFVELLRQLSPTSPVLRIGGDSTDWTWWPVPGMAQPPGVKLSLTRAMLRTMHQVATTLGARLILGVNLEADSRQLAAAEAHAFTSIVGGKAIAGLEIGNEPELYPSFGWYKSAAGLQVPGRPKGYGLPQFTQDFTSFAKVIHGAPLAGPSSGSPNWLPHLSQFLAAEPKLGVATVHAYPLKHCGHASAVTIGQMLSNGASHGLATHVAPFVAAAKAHRVPLRVDEMNAISCGGMRGVSDSFASALWVLDTLFELDRAGVNGVNIHTVPDTINEIIGPVGTGSKAPFRVHPEFYGMVMFSQAAPAGSRLLRINDQPMPGVKLWATRAPDGKIRVVVINKNTNHPATVKLVVPSAEGTATAEQLVAASASARSGVTLGGQTFGARTSTGQLTGAATLGSIPPAANGMYAVQVPAASATLLTFSPG